MIDASMELLIKAPELRGASLALGSCRDMEVCLDGPAGTGKTFGALYKIHTLLSLYPDAKALVARKSNTSLAGSAMATYRSMLDEHEGVRYFGGNKVKPAAFEYPNGSMMTVSGLDKPEKVRSWEFDIAFLNEATECTVEDVEFVRSRLRHGKLPYHQLIMDVNPGPPSHWLNVRMNQGITTRLRSVHEDNPRFFDATTQGWTEEGRAYIFGVLEGLTGVRYLRMRKGIWAAAEGLVYNEWNPAIHVVTREQLKKWEVLYTDGTLNRQVIRHVIGAADWGLSNPGVLQAWGLDGDMRMYLLAEIYRTQRTDDWWIQQALQLDQEFHIEQWVADPSQPAYIRKFNEAGLPMIGAENAILPGVTAMQSRLQLARDGRPRMFIYEYALRDRDELRDEAHQPVWFEGEMNEYVWPKTKDGQPVKEVPVKMNDHSMDCCRYACMYLERVSVGITDTDRDTLAALRRYRGY